MNYTETEEYASAHTAYVGEMAAAQASENPDIAKLQAENRWLQKQGELRSLAEQRTALEGARATARQQYANVPEVLYANATSAEQVLSQAKAAAEAMGAQQTPQTPPSQQSWGAPPTSGQGAPPQGANLSDTERKYRDEEYMSGLIEKANNNAGDGAGHPSRHVEELMDVLIDNKIFHQMKSGSDGKPVRE